MIIRNIFGLAVVIYSLCCTNDSKQINLPSPDNLCLIDNEHTKFDKCPLLAIWGESLWGMKEVTGPELLALKRTSVWWRVYKRSGETATSFSAQHAAQIYLASPLARLHLLHRP